MRLFQSFESFIHSPLANHYIISLDKPYALVLLLGIDLLFVQL